MESLVKPTDQSLESPENPKRRRRWWLGIAFLLLASLVVFGVVVFAEGEQPTYRFLAQAKPTSVDEYISNDASLPNTWIRQDEFQSDLPFDALAAKARKELSPSEWNVTRQGSAFVIFSNTRGGKAVLLRSERSGTSISVGQFGSATIFDRVRLWFRDFGRQEPSAENSGAPFVIR